MEGQACKGCSHVVMMTWRIDGGRSPCLINQIPASTEKSEVESKTAKVVPGSAVMVVRDETGLSNEGTCIRVQV